MTIKLTAKQRRFVEAYAGNGTEAARVAGYKGNDETLAQVAAENLRKPYLAEAIKSRESKVVKGLIANREERQKFWTEFMYSKQTKDSDRLKASELLARSEADFTDKLEHSGNIGLESWTDEQLQKRLDELEKK